MLYGNLFIRPLVPTAAVGVRGNLVSVATRLVDPATLRQSHAKTVWEEGRFEGVAT